MEIIQGLQSQKNIQIKNFLQEIELSFWTLIQMIWIEHMTKFKVVL